MKSRKTKLFSMKNTQKNDSAGTDSLAMQRPSPPSNLDSGLATKLRRLLRLDAESCQMREARREYVARISFSSHSQVSTVPLKLAAKVLDDSEEENMEAKTPIAGGTGRCSQTLSDGETQSTSDDPERPNNIFETSIINEISSSPEVTPHNQSSCKAISPTIMPKKIPRSESAISFNSLVEVINIPRAKDYSRSTRHKLW